MIEKKEIKETEWQIRNTLAGWVLCRLFNAESCL